MENIDVQMFSHCIDICCSYNLGDEEYFKYVLLERLYIEFDRTMQQSMSAEKKCQFVLDMVSLTNVPLNNTHDSLQQILYRNRCTFQSVWPMEQIVNRFDVPDTYMHTTIKKYFFFQKTTVISISLGLRCMISQNFQKSLKFE